MKPTQVTKPKSAAQITPPQPKPAPNPPAQSAPQSNPLQSVAPPQVSSVLTNEQVAQQAARLQGQVNGEIRQKRKYTKRVQGGAAVPGTHAIAPQAAPIPLETLEGIIPVPFEAIAEFRNCPAWKLSSEKTKAMAIHVQVIMKYISPDTSELTAAVTGLVLVAGAHAYSAIMVERELAKQAEIQSVST